MQKLKNAQHYRIKSALPVCGNCKFAETLTVKTMGTEGQKDICTIGKFEVDVFLGTCPSHEWRK